MSLDKARKQINDLIEKVYIDPSIDRPKDEDEIKKGKVKINFFDEHKKYLENRILKTGDVILLVSGGHDFEMLEDTEMIEVKQGPYAGEADKECFEGIIDDTCK